MRGCLSPLAVLVRWTPHIKLRLAEQSADACRTPHSVAKEEMEVQTGEASEASAVDKEAQKQWSNIDSIRMRGGPIRN